LYYIANILKKKELYINKIAKRIKIKK